MATKYRAVCNTCDYKGNAFTNPISAKVQRNNHQIETNYEHNVGIEITEEVVSFISSDAIDSITNEKSMKKLFKIK